MTNDEKLTLPTPCNYCNGSGKAKSSLTMNEIRCMHCGGTGLRAELKIPIATESALAAGAASIDTPEFRQLLNLTMSKRFMSVSAGNKAAVALIAHINEWGAQQREAGRQEGYAKKVSAAECGALAMLEQERERAEKAEAALADVKRDEGLAKVVIEQLKGRLAQADAALAQRAAGVVYLSSLKRYSPTYDESRGADGEDRWGVMEDAEEGEYVKLTDVRALLATAPVGDGDERAKALEEAARLVDGMHERISDPFLIGQDRAEAGHNTLTNVAAAIRALIQQKGGIMDIDKERAAGKPDFSKFATLEEYNEAMADWQRGQDTAPPAAVPAQIRHVAVLNDSDRERLDWSVRTLRGLADTDPAPAGFATILSVIGAIKRVLEPSLLDAAPAQAVDALRPILERMTAYCEDFYANAKVRGCEKVYEHVAKMAGEGRAALAAQPAAPAGEPVAYLTKWNEGKRQCLSYKPITARLAEMGRADDAVSTPLYAAPVANAGQAGQWILVSTSLPPNDQYVWASWSGAGNWSHDPKQGLARHIAGMGWQPMHSMGWDWHVTHWMPLPPAPDAPDQAAQVAQPFPTSRDAYEKMTPERKAALDADLKGLEQRIESHRRNRDRRTHTEQVEFDRRKGDRRHAERRDAED